MFFRCIILTSVFLLKSQGIFFELDSVCDREELRMRWAYLLVELYVERFFCFVLFCFVFFFGVGWGGWECQVFLLGILPGKNHAQIKLQPFPKV